MAKYTKEEKQKAIDLYIRYCKQATKAIKNLTPLSTLPIGWIEVKDSAILRGLATHRTKSNHMLYLLQPRAPWRTVRRKASRKKHRIVSGWIALHEEELYLQWNNAVRNKPLTKIEPLK